MLFIISASNGLLMLYGVVSFLSFSCRNLTTPSSVACINMKVAAPPYSLSTSLRTFSLPVINKRVFGDPYRICPNPPRTTIRYSGTHSSSASTHINVPRGCDCLEHLQNPRNLESPTPNSPFLFRKSLAMASGISPPLLTSCLSREPSIFAGNCSFRAAESKQKHTTVASPWTASSHSLSIASELSSGLLAIGLFNSPQG